MGVVGSSTQARFILSVLRNWDNGGWGIGRQGACGAIESLWCLLATAMVLLVAAVAVGAGAFNQ